MSVVLLTGGFGFIGSHVRELLVKDERVSKLVCTKNRGGITPTEQRTGFVEAHIDLTIKQDVDWLMEEFSPDIIFHLAANPNVKEDINNPTEITLTNILATHNLLANCKPGTIFNFASSSAVYGDLPFPATEEDECFPTSIYGVTKLASENYIRIYEMQKEIYGNVFRLSANVGANATHGVVLDLYRKAKYNASHYLELLGDEPGSSKPYNHVRDTAAFMVEHGFSKNTLPYLVNLANNSISVKTIAEIILQETDVKKELKWLGREANWKGDNREVQISDAVARVLQGWEPIAKTSEDAVRMAVQEMEQDCVNNKITIPS